MAIQHGVIADPFIHEPRGISSAAPDTVYLADGAGSGDWTTAKDSVFPFTTDSFAEIYFASNGIVLAGATEDPGRETTSGSLLFDSATDETVYVSIPVPRGRKADGDVRLYILWSKTTSATGDVEWVGDYKILNIGAVLSGGWTNLVSEDTPLTTDDDTADKIMITSLGGLDVTTLDNNMFIDFRISRTPAASNYGADARLQGVLITYTVADLGDDDEFTP